MSDMRKLMNLTESVLSEFFVGSDEQTDEYQNDPALDPVRALGKELYKHLEWWGENGPVGETRPTDPDYIRGRARYWDLCKEAGRKLGLSAIEVDAISARLNYRDRKRERGEA